MSCCTVLPLHPLHPSICWRKQRQQQQQQEQFSLAASCHLLSSSSSLSVRSCGRGVARISPRFCSRTILAPRSSGGQDGPESPLPASRSPGLSKKGFGRSSSGAGGSKKKEKGGPTTDGKKKGRGFGGTGPEQGSGVLVDQGANSSSSSEKRKGLPSRLSKVVDAVDKKSSAPLSSSSSIDPSQAKLGRVDFVRVQNWGSEEGEDAPKLEDLRVKSFSPAATSTSTSTSSQSSNSMVPFYEELVNRLQLLESKGEIAVAQAKPLPSFDRWAFGEDLYLQFLVDQLSVFEALREAIAAIRKERCMSVAEGLEEVMPLGGAASGIGLFGVELGLDRCEALSADIAAIASSSHSGEEFGVESLTATTQAAGYAKYISQLGKASVGGGDKPKEACLKLMSHLFAVYVSHLTTGMRIGAKAMDNVTSLRQTKALSFYRDYPKQVKDPLKLFVATINAAGAQITSDDDHEQVMDELPKAFQKTSLLLSVLAVEEPLLVESS